MKISFKRLAPYLAAIATFYLICIGYFAPAVFEGKTLMGSDVRIGYAVGADLRDYSERHPGEKSLWSSRMFSGMPTYQMTPNHATGKIQSFLRTVYEGGLPNPVGLIFGLMLGFFILLCALKVNPWVGIVGAIAYAFSSYFFILIPAGHIWKLQALELVAPTIAGVVLAYRGRYLIGGAVTALFFSLQLFANHPQMTYYFLLLIGLFIVGYLITAIKEKLLKKFALATIALVVGFGMGFANNAANMVLSNKYATQTIRAPSELTNNEENKSAGLDKDYATQWSYGIGETFTLLIPNTKGGASEAIGTHYMDKVKSNVNDPTMQQITASFSSYFGKQPFTAGPVYVGAFVMFLFILGLFVVKGPIKWVMLVGTAVSIMLAWGHNFMWFTNLFFDYFPFYNKFRTVSSILVVAELCIPLLATLALAELVKNAKLLLEQKQAFYISLAATAGLILLFIIMPTVFFDFSPTDNDKQTVVHFAQQYPDAPQHIWQDALSSLEDVRVAIFRADAWRSLLIVALGVCFLLLYYFSKIGAHVLLACVGGLILVDMGLVNKRYINNSMFGAKANVDLKALYPKTEADKYILQDTDPNYRVFNLTSDAGPFNDGQTSYFHKSIGGYHAAKLRRYQDVIEGYLSKMDMNVLNMLNTKYVIVPNNQGQPQAQRNPEALGHAWFVDTIQWVSSADEEFAALKYFNPSTVAVVDKRFEQQLGSLHLVPDTTSFITLASYDLDDLNYKVKAANEKLAVFSEIYYSDGLSHWDAFVDGQPTEIARVNYLLRAIRIPAGEHNVQFIFRPKAYKTLNSMSMASMWLTLLLVAGSFGLEGYRGRKKEKGADGKVA